MKVALVYDRINKWGGAERVLLALHKLFPKAPVFTSVYYPQHAAWAKDFIIKPSFLQRFPHIVGNHELYPFLMPLAFERFSFADYDLVISLTSEAAKGIVTKPGTKHICYCLTPTRYLWSGYEEYFQDQSFRTFTSPIVSYLRKWDKIAASRPDVYLAISQEVRKRIKNYYAREAMIVYPPVELLSSRHSGKQSASRISNHINRTDSGQARMTDYFLIVSRLSKFTKYKRIDLAIQACNELKLPLKIIGEGSWKKELQKMAGPSIEFLDNVDDKQLKKYYAQCRALIFPAMEDFGLTVVEAQGFGKPVIAYRGGGALETIKEGKTGLFFDKQTKDSLKSALIQFQKMKFDPSVAIKNAQQFDQAHFEKNFLKLVHQVI
ncbi:MAG: glycosyltransferase [Candidatus Levyibacteriota bacterium]